MASYFVASRARPDGVHPVHDRGRCPPESFPRQASEYLGEFIDAAQALVVARQVYAAAGTCTCCHSTLGATPAWLRSAGVGGEA